MDRPTTKGFQKPLAGKPKPVGLAMITEPAPGALACSCEGFVSTHQRKKVREDQAQRHLDKRHEGRGIWL